MRRQLSTVLAPIASLALAAAANAGVLSVFSTGFEASEGYTVGQLGGQNGWTVRQGTSASPVNPNFARVITASPIAGSQSVILDATQLLTMYSNIWGETFRGAFVGRNFSLPASIGPENFTALEMAYTATWNPGVYGGTAAPTSGIQPYSGPNYIGLGGCQGYQGVNYCGMYNYTSTPASITFAAPSTHRIVMRVDYTTNTLTCTMDGTLAATLPQNGTTAMPDNFAFTMYNASNLLAIPSTMVIDDVVVSAIYTNPCRADFNNADGVTVADIFTFLTAWFAGDVRADFDHVGGVAVPDIFAFLTAWFAGC